MNKGVELLLARMESNPEEFVRGGKWEWVISRVIDRMQSPYDSTVFLFLNNEEVEALYRGVLSIQSEVFISKVMSELLDATYVVDEQMWG